MPSSVARCSHLSGRDVARLVVVAGLVPNLAWMRISKRTGYKFADFCSDYSTLRPIQALFEAEDFVPKPGYDGPEGGQRRFLVGSFHANIDFDDPAQTAPPSARLLGGSRFLGTSADDR